MPKEFNSINTLVIIENIAAYLSPRDAVSFALTSKNTFFNMHRSLKRLKISLKVHELSTLVAYGKQDEAEKLLNTAHNAQFLLVTSVPFTDYSGRRFVCTAYEYAYWAKDTHMCRMLETKMETKTKENMLERCQAIEKKGLTYSQYGVVIESSKEFDLSPLKKALEIYSDGYNNWSQNNQFSLLLAAWMEVGKMQREVPAHIANEFCRTDYRHDYQPNFKEEKLMRELSFYNTRTGVRENWFPLAPADSHGLGVNYAIICGNGLGHAQRLPFFSGMGAYNDLVQLTELDKVRTLEREQSLENLITESSLSLAVTAPK